MTLSRFVVKACVLRILVVLFYYANADGFMYEVSYVFVFLVFFDEFFNFVDEPIFKADSPKTRFLRGHLSHLLCMW